MWLNRVLDIHHFDAGVPQRRRQAVEFGCRSNLLLFGRGGIPALKPVRRSR